MGLLAKRLSIRVDGMRLVSGNPACEPICVCPGASSGLFGKVVWTGAASRRAPKVCDDR